MRASARAPHLPPAPRALAALVVALALVAAPSRAQLPSHVQLTLEGAQTGDLFGASVAGGRDFDGDGLPDVAVGAPGFPAGSGDGRVLLFRGGAGMDSLPDLRFESGGPASSFGQSVAWAGDFNGDGFQDLIVGSPAEWTDGRLTGRARIYFGGPAADSIPDLVLNPTRPTTSFGWSVAGVGDINADGFDDVLVGAPTDSGQTDYGQVYVYFGGPQPDSIADLELHGGFPGGKFGFAVGSAGDFNHDGYPDFIVGEPMATVFATQGGHISIYLGGPLLDSYADLQSFGFNFYGQLGTVTGSVGDVNGDGIDDVIATEVVANSTYLYYGHPGEDLAIGQWFGGGRAAVGGLDMNGDGLNDIATGDYWRAMVYLGGNPVENNPDLVFIPPESNFPIPMALAAAGDLDGDGVQELLVGYGGRPGTWDPNGRVYVVVADLIQVASPNGGEILHGGDSMWIGWRGQNLTDVALSLDGGASWRTLASSVPASTTSIVQTVPDTVCAAALIRASITGHAPTGKFADVSDGPFQIAAYTLDRPRDGETWLVGAADTVSWYGALRADVAISVDGGLSWTPLASGVGGSRLNVLRVIVPALTTASATVRVSASGLPISALSSVTSVGRLRLVRFELVSPNGGELWDAGRPATVHWRGSTRADIALSFDDGVTWSTIASDVGGAPDNSMSVTAPATVSLQMRVRVSAHGLPLEAGSYDVSDAPFYNLTPPPYSPLPMRTVIAPFIAAIGANFGVTVASAGDFNGDGYDDVIVGAPSFDSPTISDVGRAYLFFGGPNADDRPDVTFISNSIGAHFGTAVASAGDMNGDGFDDVIIGAPDYGGSAGIAFGTAFVYFGGEDPDSVADLKIGGSQTRFRVGTTVAGVGDVNGDGYDDIVISNQTVSPDPPTALCYFGGPQPDAIADWAMAPSGFANNFGTVVAAAGDMNGDGYADVAVADPEISSNTPGSVYVFLGGPQPNSAAALVLTGLKSDRFGGSLASAGDVNGDGFDDLLVGAQFNDTATQDAGAAFLYLGGRSLHGTPDAVFTGKGFADEFGAAVASAGDLNADGFDDIIIGAYRNDAAGLDAGRAYVYYGRPQMDTIADVVLSGARAGDNFGIAVASAGDYDGDGLPDLIVGAKQSDTGASNAGQAYVYAMKHPTLVAPVGGETWMAGEPDTIRWSGDSRADVAISLDGGASWIALATGAGGAAQNALAILTPAVATGVARVRVSLSGAPPVRITSDTSGRDFRIAFPVPQGRAVTVARSVASGTFAGEGVGLAIAAAGDVNGDGFPDWLSGSRRDPGSGAGPDRVRLMFGGPAPLAPLVLEVPAPAAPLGLSLAAAGDFNHDGFGDVVVGSPGDGAMGPEAGRAFVFFGGAEPGATPGLVLEGGVSGAHFGASVACAGDANGDGIDDLLVGAPLDATAGDGAGRVFLYRGGSAPDAIADAAWSGMKPGDRFGAALAGVGDVNADRLSDFVVGAPGNDAAGSDAGRAYVFEGAGGPVLTPTVTLTGEHAHDGFGTAVAGAGDVNGDGFDDVLIAAPFNGAAGSTSGRVYEFFGGARLSATPNLAASGAVAGEFFGIALSGAGDLNRDGFDDIAIGAPFSAAAGRDAGRVAVYLGGLIPDASPDFLWTGRAAGDRFGAALAGVGDANGDGFDDLLIGAPFHDGSVPDAGAVTLYDARRYVVISPRGGERWDVGGSQSVRWLGPEPADVWLSSDAGRDWRLLAQAAGGADTNSIAFRVPRPASDSVRVRLTPSNPRVPGSVTCDSLLAIRAAVTLHDFTVTPGTGHVTIAWSTDPEAGGAGLAGYRLYRIAPRTGEVDRLGPALVTTSPMQLDETERGATYVLVAVNGLGEEAELGRVSLPAPRPGITAWPVPLEEHGTLSLTIVLPADAAGFTPPDLDVGVFDLQGRRVADLLAGARPTTVGLLDLRWDARGAGGSRLPSGIYVVRAIAPSAAFRHEKKIAILR